MRQNEFTILLWIYTAYYHRSELNSSSCDLGSAAPMSGLENQKGIPLWLHVNRTMEECEIVRAVTQVCRVASKRTKQLDSFLLH